MDRREINKPIKPIESPFLWAFNGNNVLTIINIAYTMKLITISVFINLLLVTSVSGKEHLLCILINELFGVIDWVGIVVLKFGVSAFICCGTWLYGGVVMV